MPATSKVLFQSPLLKLSDFSCDTPKSGCTCERCDTRSSLTLVRRGVHAYHARRRMALAEPGIALLYRGGEAYCLSHPYHREQPDRSTCIEFDDALLKEAFGETPRERDLGSPLSPRMQLLHYRIVAALHGKAEDALAAEEAIISLIDAVARDWRRPAAEPRRARSARQKVARARAFIAANPSTNHGLQKVADAAACSPFHLARLFKVHSGMTLRGYRLNLRLSIVLQELADGADDLASLAHRTGFSHHSHLTASLQRQFGSSPRALRESLRGRGLLKKSKFLKAALHPAD